MADLCEAFRTRLTEHAGTAALIGTRAFFDHLPKGPTLPAVVVQQISGRPVPAMGADTGNNSGRVQTDAYAATRAGAQLLGAQMRAALKRYRGTVAGVEVDDVFLEDEEGPSEEEETGRWRVRMDWTAWWRD